VQSRPAEFDAALQDNRAPVFGLASISMVAGRPRIFAEILAEFSNNDAATRRQALN